MSLGNFRNVKGVRGACFISLEVFGLPFHEVDNGFRVFVNVHGFVDEGWAATEIMLDELIVANKGMTCLGFLFRRSRWKEGRTGWLMS